MKIKFEIEGDKKKIKLWFRHGDFEKIAKQIVKEKQDTDNVSRNISYFVYEVLEKLSKKLQMPLIEFKPSFVMYKRESELPRHLQEEII